MLQKILVLPGFIPGGGGFSLGSPHAQLLLECQQLCQADVVAPTDQ